MKLLKLPHFKYHEMFALLIVVHTIWLSERIMFSLFIRTQKTTNFTHMSNVPPEQTFDPINSGGSEQTPLRRYICLQLRIQQVQQRSGKKFQWANYFYAGLLTLYGVG